MNQDHARVLIVDDEIGIQRIVRANLVARGYEVEIGGHRRGGARSRHSTAAGRDSAGSDAAGLTASRILSGACGAGRPYRWSCCPRAGKIASRSRLSMPVRTTILQSRFSVEELLARVRVSLRHARRIATRAPRSDRTRRRPLDRSARQQVTRAGQEIRLTPTELALLLTLARHGDRVVTHSSLLQEVWGRGYSQETQYLHVHIGNLRRKLGDDPAQPWAIVTEPGTGYRLRTDAGSS